MMRSGITVLVVWFYLDNVGEETQEIDKCKYLAVRNQNSSNLVLCAGTHVNLLYNSIIIILIINNKAPSARKTVNSVMGKKGSAITSK